MSSGPITMARVKKIKMYSIGWFKMFGLYKLRELLKLLNMYYGVKHRAKFKGGSSLDQCDPSKR